MHICIIFEGMSHYTLQITVKCHILKYLQYYFPTPYFISENDYVGPILISMLRRPEHDRSNCTGINLTEKWPVVITHKMVHDRGARHLSSRNLNNFNTCIDKIMDAELYNYVELRHSMGFEKNESIQLWLAKFGILESMSSWETWKKRYQRFGYYRIKKNLK